MKRKKQVIPMYVVKVMHGYIDKLAAALGKKT